MKEMLGNLADGEIEFYKSVRHANVIMEIPILTRMLRQWKNGTESYQSFNAFEWMYSSFLILPLRDLFFVNCN